MRYILGLFVLFAVSQFAQAQYFIGPMARGAGGAGRAAADPLETGSLNPAALVLLEKYHAGAFYLINEGNLLTDNRQYGISLADGTKDVLFPGSLYYRRQTFEPRSSAIREDLHGSFAQTITQGLSVGVSVHYLRIRDLLPESHSEFNGDVGFLWKPAARFQFGATAYHLGASGENLPDLGLRQREWAVGSVLLINELLAIRTDYTQLFESPSARRAMFGLDGPMRGDMRWRLGAQEDNQTETTRWTAGVGWDGPRLKFDYSFQSATRGRDEKVHGFDLWLHF